MYNINVRSHKLLIIVFFCLIWNIFKIMNMELNWVNFKHIISWFSNDILSGELFKVINRKALKILSVYYQNTVLLHKHPIIRRYMDKAKSCFIVYLSHDNNFRRISIDQTVEKKTLTIIKKSRGTQNFSSKPTFLQKLYISSECRTKLLHTMR